MQWWCGTLVWWGTFPHAQKWTGKKHSLVLWNFPIQILRVREYLGCLQAAHANPQHGLASNCYSLRIATQVVILMKTEKHKPVSLLMFNLIPQNVATTYCWACHRYSFSCTCKILKLRGGLFDRISFTLMITMVRPFSYHSSLSRYLTILPGKRFAVELACNSTCTSQPAQ